MNPSLTPHIAPFFVKHVWDLESADTLNTELMKAIVQDPEIRSKSSISVDIVHDGRSVSEIRLIGSVEDAREKSRAKEIVKVNTRDEVTVVNDLVVGS